MRVFTCSEARRRPSAVLEQAESRGKGLIRRNDGRTLALRPERDLASPLDLPAVKTDLSTQEIVDTIREGREKTRARRSTGRG